MSVCRCQNCDTVVPRGRFCSRCGSPQPALRLLPGLVAIVGMAASVGALTLALRVLGPSSSEFRSPPSSGGKWTSEEDEVPERVDDHSPSYVSPLDISERWVAPTR
jgi:hypothetical protein